ncbi:P-loop NTPase fold protein [Sphaerisporangium aureirubrum]|uniref:P-loop NTPase fold protein n=1 Tax=Sphaerisporangium aureirubrum TaxID=1544736 RepID=UPI003642356A
MTSMIVTAPPAPAIRNRKALVFLDRDGTSADRRLVHALNAEGYAVRTAECGDEEQRRVGAFLDDVEPGDLLLVRWSTESGWGRREFGALMAEFARRVEQSDGAALLLVVDFGWLVTVDAGHPHETVGRLRVKGEPVAAAAALTTSATMPGERPGQTVSLTAILADGILSGAADLDRDGTVTVGDLFRYAEERCAELGADRRPYLLTYGEGELIGVAHAPGPARHLGAAFGTALARLAVTGDPVPPLSATELVARVYEVHLGENARRLLRRATLLDDDEPLTPDLAYLLTEGTPLTGPDGEPWPAETGKAAEVEEAVGELLAWGLLGERTPVADPAVRHAGAGRLEPGELARVSAALRRRRAARRAVRPRARLTGDRWTIRDRLGHRVHAEAAAAFIRHLDTRPPLTIGVKGPWGAGKTSLMRMIQDVLDPGAAEGRPAPIHLNRDDATLTNAEVLARMRAPRERPDDHAVPGALPLREGDWRPTVWFNPWMYQNGEQVWAGLAHEIIGQVTDRLPRGERERFWLALNLARIDRETVRRRAYRLALTRLLPVALALCGTLLLTVASLAAATLVPSTGSLLRGAAAAVGAGGTLVAVLAAAVRLARFLGESADTAFGGLVSRPDVLTPSPELVGGLTPDPGYGVRTGFLHLVQTDMRHVLGMVASAERPLVVFVDDLDRCSPGTVAQVIEAVNLFLAGEFPDCVFVLAMDPEVVAAHVEMAYGDLARSLPPGTLEQSGLGWRFLEKIVQLPLSVPLLDDGDRLPSYLRALLGVRAPADRRAASGGETVVEDAAGKEVVDLLEAEIRALRPSADDLDAVARRVEAGREPGAEGTRIGGLSAATRLAADRVYDDLYSDENAYAAIRRVLPVLSLTNPRELKRYVNVFRFYCFVTYRRALAGAPRASDDEVAKLALLTIRWPHLLSLFTRDLGDLARAEGGGPTVLDSLERAAPAADADWTRALTAAGLAGAGGETVTRWDALRALLAARPSIAPLARDLL